jgi:3-carboxy-cis,cis-muconate cycloisomerase
VADRWSDGLLEAGFGDAATAALVGWPARVQRMLEVEAALGRALGRVGLIADTEVAAIQRVCEVPSLDLERLAEEASAAATPVLPLLQKLQEACSEPAAWLHHGATSQDVIDTAAVLQLRDASARLDTLLGSCASRCAALADEARDDVSPGRTLLQHAAPVTVGLRAARWLGALDRRREALAWAASRASIVQCGGLVGTAAVYGERGHEVATALADELGLDVPTLPWHAERDRVADLAGMLAGLTSTVASIAAELVRLSGTDIGELTIVAVSPTSSAAPHKRNPVDAVAARAAARLALGEAMTLLQATGEHEHERAAGAWQLEWVALPSALVRTGGALARLDAALAATGVDADRAARNLDDLQGLLASEQLVAAMAPQLGRQQAQEVVASLAAEVAAGEGTLAQRAAVDERVTRHLDADAIERTCDPVTALGGVSAAIDRALDDHARVRDGHR